MTKNQTAARILSVLAALLLLLTSLTACEGGVTREEARGAMDALLDSGLKIPEDVSVLGFDDLPLAERIRPKLTTIHQPLDLIVSEILNYFSIPVLQEKGREILLKHSLVMRDSCMALPEKGGKNE